MKLLILGRTQILLNAARMLLDAGHEIVAVITAPPSDFYSIGIDAFKALAVETNAYFYAGTDLGNCESFLKDAKIDVGISVNWPLILNQDFLKLFKYGVLNAHMGDLPRYRGNACPNWAILNGETSIGFVVHKMIPGEVDAGLVLAKEIIEIDDDTYIQSIYNKSYDIFPRLFINAIEKISYIGLKPGDNYQSRINTHRCFPRIADDARIQWSHDANHIYRLVRASSKPFNGAFAFTNNNRKLIVWRARPTSVDFDYSAVPGQYISKNDHMPIIACGNGQLLLEQATFEDNTDALIYITTSFRNRLF